MTTEEQHHAEHLAADKSTVLPLLAGKGRPPRRGTRRRKASNKMWGGSRFYTNRAIEHIDKIRGRPAINSRKRFEAFGNPGSDHFHRNLRADAYDANLTNDQRAATSLAKELGWDGSGQFPSFGTFITRRKGKSYQHQIIWTTHGTGPHLHYGVHRV